MGAWMKTLLAAAGLAVWLATGQAQHSTTNPTFMKLNISTTAFTPGQPIPSKYAYENENLSPALAWSGVPASAKCLALICDDPDAPRGTWVHWVLYNVPVKSPGLAEGVAKKAELPDGSKQGVNDYKEIGYGGPCPPPGKPHRYFFKLYALDSGVELKAGATKGELLKAMAGHILAEGELMGTYQKK